jgi:hypothetical protein
MNKFLKLCEEFDPSNQDTLDAALWVHQILSQADIPFSADGDEIHLPVEYGTAILKVIAFEKDIDVAPVEDEEINAGVGTYEVDSEVEKLGNKASKGLKGMVAKGLGTSAQRAKTAVKKRERVAADAVKAYEKGTDRIKAGLRNVGNAPLQNRY